MQNPFGHKYVLEVYEHTTHPPYNDKNPPTPYVLISIKPNQSH